jgi:hypothetical protein
MVSHNSGDRIVEIASGLIEADWEVVYRTNGDQFWIVLLAPEAGYCPPRESQTTKFADRPQNRVVVDKSLIRPNVFHDGLIARFFRFRSAYRLPKKNQSIRTKRRTPPIPPPTRGPP